jgi:peroxiredoxin
VSEPAEKDLMAAADIDAAFAPLPRTDVTAVVLDGEAVILAEGANSAQYLDELATLVWNTFDGEATIDELAEDFADVFHTELDVVRQDILRLTRSIGRAGLLEGIAYEAPPEPSFAWPTGVDVGEPIPPFRLPDAGGREVAIADLRGREVLLVNWSPRCGFCTRIAPELAELQPALGARGVEMVFITLGEAEENRALLEEYGLQPNVLFGNGDTEVFAGVGTPAAYLVDAAGRAASGLAIGADKVPELARSAAGPSISSSAGELDDRVDGISGELQ